MESIWIVGLTLGGSPAPESGSIGGGDNEKWPRKWPCRYCSGVGAGVGPESITGHKAVTMVPIRWLEVDRSRRWPKVTVALGVGNSENIGESPRKMGDDC